MTVVDQRRRAPDGRLYVATSHRRRVAAAGERPYSVATLAMAMGLDPFGHCLTSQLVVRLGLYRRTVVLYRRIGLTERQADRWAARAGLHPDLVWGATSEPDDEPAPAPAWMQP